MSILQEYLHKAIIDWKPNILGHGKNFYEEFLIVGKFSDDELLHTKAWYVKATSDTKMLPKTVSSVFQYITDRGMYENEMKKLGYIIVSETMGKHWPHFIRTLYTIQQDYSLTDLE